MTPSEAENPLSGYGKTVSHVIVGLKTVKGTKQLRLDPTIYEAILKEKIVVGDVIYVEANTGAVKVCLSRGARKYTIYQYNCSVWVGRMPMHHHMTLNPRLMSHFPKGTSTSAKSLCKTSLSVILTPPMPDRRAGRTS